MILLEKICEELGVEVGEEWTGTGNFKYKIENNKFYMSFNDVDFIEADADEYVSLCKGEIKPEWRPKDGDNYYIPDIFKEDLWSICNCEEDELDNLWYERGLIFKTKEEALDCTNKMLEAIK